MDRKLKRRLFLLLSIGVLLAGCTRRERHLPYPCLPGAKQIGTSVEQRPIEALVLGSGEETILMMASIHGNEVAGTPLLQQLVKLLAAKKQLLEGKRVVLLPIANPDGYVHNVRYNSHGIDLNRNFGASNRQNLARYGTSQLSEPESLLIAGLLQKYRPTRIVSIHQPMSCIDYDGPAEELAQLMVRYCELPVKRIGSRPGSLGSYAGVDLGIPIITLELPRKASSLAPGEAWRRYGRTLLAAVTYPSEPQSLGTLSGWGVFGLFSVLLCAAVVIRLTLNWRHRH